MPAPDPIALNAGALRALAPEVSVPRYDRTAVTPGIAHLGVGNFHRAHQADYLDRLFDAGAARDWGIVGIGAQPQNAALRDVLRRQDFLYTRVLRHADGTWEPRVIGSIIDFVLAPDDPRACIEMLADPTIRIVSLTVTEGGYLLDAVTGRLDPEHPAVQADARSDEPPSTVFGLVADALALRRARALPGVTVVSCDNIAGNGAVAEQAFGTVAELRHPGLSNWLADQVRFPNSMVDRITPQTTDADRGELARRFGLLDGWPVMCEPFAQWVLEDDFANGRPPLQDVGVSLVPDVAPYELMKLRLLNASHQALCYPARLVGYALVHDVIADEAFTDFLLRYMLSEAIPTLPPVPGIDLPGYAAQLLERFANPEVGDTVARLCQHTSELIPKFLLPVIRDNLRAGRPISCASAVIAFWARYALGVDERGRAYDIDDPRETRLRAAAAHDSGGPAFLDANADIFGDLLNSAVFRDAFTAAAVSIRERGVRETLRMLADDALTLDR